MPCLFHKSYQVESFKRCSGFSHILGEFCDKIIGFNYTSKTFGAHFSSPAPLPKLPKPLHEWISMLAENTRECMATHLPVPFLGLILATVFQLKLNWDFLEEFCALEVF